MLDALRPERVWRASSTLHARGRRRTARLLKAFNWWVYRAVLPPEVTIGQGLVLYHRGLGVVVHPNTVLGDGVHIAHGVTIGSAAEIGSADKVVIDDRVMVGAGAILFARRGRSLHVGSLARIGAGAVVVEDVPSRSTMVGNPARIAYVDPGRES